MKHFEKGLFINLIMILILVSVSLQGCSANKEQSTNSMETLTNEESQQQNSSMIATSLSTEYQNQSRIADEIKLDNNDVDTFCAKEISKENRIYFNYPQFKGNIDNAEKLNELVVSFVKSTLQNDWEDFNGNIKDEPESWKWNEVDYTVRALTANYKIVRIDDNYLSITFEGESNHKGAAHPTNYFNSLIIDVKNFKIVSLSDLYNTNSDFVELIQKNYKKQARANMSLNIGVSIDSIPKSIEDYFNSEDSQIFLSYLQKANLSDTGYNVFMTASDLGISIPISHAVGDHIEILINFNELTSYIK